jgi:hypothetical protein
MAATAHGDIKAATVMQVNQRDYTCRTYKAAHMVQMAFKNRKDRYFHDSVALLLPKLTGPNHG